MQLRSYNTINRGDWCIKASILGTENILIFMFNTFTMEAMCKGFSSDIEANLFVEYMLNKNVKEDENNE